MDFLKLLRRGKRRRADHQIGTGLRLGERDGLRAFYLTSKQAHDWRMRLKAEVDRIELEMLERDGGERQSLWWVNEIVLGILFEPLDWLFTARDLLQGDLTALIGFLPLIPGSLRHIFDAATGLKIDDIAREVGGKLDEFGEAWHRSYSDISPHSSSGNIPPGWTGQEIPSNWANENTRWFFDPKNIPEWAANQTSFEEAVRLNNYGIEADHPIAGKILMPIEIGALYRSDGSLVAMWVGDSTFTYDKKGVLREVYNSRYSIRDLAKEFPGELKGGTFTHFHPTGGSLSQTDINNTARSLQFGLANFRAFTPAGGYTLKLPDMSSTITDDKIKIFTEYIKQQLEDAAPRINTMMEQKKDVEAYDNLWKSIFGQEDNWQNLAKPFGFEIDEAIIIKLITD